MAAVFEDVSLKKILHNSQLFFNLSDAVKDVMEYYVDQHIIYATDIDKNKLAFLRNSKFCWSFHFAYAKIDKLRAKCDNGIIKVTEEKPWWIQCTCVELFEKAGIILINDDELIKILAKINVKLINI